MERNPGEVPEANQSKLSVMMAGPPTPAMALHGVDWFGVKTYAQKAIKLIQNNGDKFLDMLELGFKGIAALTQRDLSGLLQLFSEGSAKLDEIVQAIRDEFGLNE